MDITEQEERMKFEKFNIVVCSILFFWCPFFAILGFYTVNIYFAIIGAIIHSAIFVLAIIYFIKSINYFWGKKC